MSHTISRLFANHEDALAAVEALKASSYGADTIHVVASPAAGGAWTQGAEDGIAAAIMQGGVPETHAQAYAGHVRRGETLVSVDPPFGFGGRAIAIMAQHNPTTLDLPDPGHEAPVPHDPAAPLSSFCGWPVLSDNPSPLSSWLGLTTVSASRPTARPAAALVDRPAPLSKSIGMPVLSDNPAPLSNRLGWRVLSGTATPLSTRSGMRLLLDDPAPLSKRAGMRTVSSESAPFSAKLGLRVLSDDPAPLSRLFGWRVLSSDPAPRPSWFARLTS